MVNEKLPLYILFQSLTQSKNDIIATRNIFFKNWNSHLVLKCYFSNFVPKFTLNSDCLLSDSLKTFPNQNRNSRYKRFRSIPILMYWTCELDHSISAFGGIGEELFQQ